MSRLLFAILVGLCLSVATQAADLAKPTGPVILTIHGKVANTNRGPLSEFEDGLFRANKVSFDTAAVFDLAMLERLGMHSVSTRLEKWPRDYRFEGPLLADVLKAAGAGIDFGAARIKVYGLDGFVADIAAGDLAGALLALKAEGEYLALGGRGPIWVVYPKAGDKPHEGSKKWVWAAVRIEVE